MWKSLNKTHVNDQSNSIFHDDLGDSASRLVENEVNVVLCKNAMRRVRCFGIIENFILFVDIDDCLALLF